MYWLSIDRRQKVPLIRQVYEQMRLRILSGDLRQGEKLPSTRELAQHLRVSRNVILEAYDQLLAEGYIHSLRGSGSYVAQGAYLKQFEVEPLLPAKPVEIAKSEAKDIIDFRNGIPALDMFPRKKWGQLFQNICTNAPSSVFGYHAAQGRMELRQVLAHYLIRSRGVRCDPNQVIITTGAIQGICIASQLLVSENDLVVTEDPMAISIRKIFIQAGAAHYPVPVDEHGIQVSRIPVDKKPRLIYITPAHQYPLGATLTVQRRVELVQIARDTGCYIVEDNYDNEFRFEGTAVSSLQGLEPERVIYIGTFSKILSPSLRIGYMVVPPSLIKPSRAIKDLLDHHSPSLNQLVLARFIEEGHFERHIFKMKKIYRKRQECLIESLTEHFPHRCSVKGYSTGLHIVAEFDDVVFSDLVAADLVKAGVRIYPAEMYAVNKGSHRNKIILGYGNVNEEVIKEGVIRIASVI